MSETTRRQGELVRATFDILLDTPGGMQAADVLARLAERIELNEHERADYPNRPGVRRFEKVVRFATIPAVKAGWLVKRAGTWTLTDDGRSAWKTLQDPEDFMRESVRLYQEWRAANPVESGDRDEDADSDGEEEEFYGSDPAEIVERIRALHIPSDRVEFRKQAESEAKDFLDRFAGRMTVEQAADLGKMFNRDFRGKEYHDRFKPAFHGATMNKIIEDIVAFNEWTRRLWDPDDQRALVALDEIVRESSAFPGAGRSYPTMLMYLRDPQKYAVWIPATIKGLAALTGFKSGSRADGSSAYLEFCSTVQGLTHDYGLEPQEVDIVLTVVGRHAKRARGDAFLPLSGATTFLRDLRANNTREWLDQNRGRYNRELFEPFRRLMETVAQKYVRDLDPNLVTEAKTGRVLAHLRKRWPDETGEYNDFYWGAFSRGKKQEDVQLFVSVDPDRLRYGLLLGSAQKKHIDALKEAIRSDAKRYLQLLEPMRDGLVFNVDDGERTVFEVLTEDDLLKLLDGPSPSIVREIYADDQILASFELVDAIGSLFVSLHPIAATAWGEAPRIKTEPAGEEPEERYTLDQLVADTLLQTDDIEEWIDLLRESGKRQAIFFGPPGTGKTHVARCLARYLASRGGDVRVVQFHPAFSYEDFLEGLRPLSRPDQAIGYEIRPGVFLSFCEEARGADGTFVFVIDEINRAEIGAVLGELMMLLEYRGESLELPYSRRRFSIPRNVVVLATMNTADRSLALVDFALRRRFHAIELLPSREILAAHLASRDEDPELPVKFFDLVQGRVSDRHFAPGHTFWMAEDLSPRGLDRIWRYQLKPYLREYWFENQQMLLDLENEIEVLLAEGD